MVFLKSLSLVSALVAFVSATPILYDGRAPFNLTNADLNTQTGPYLTYVLLAYRVCTRDCSLTYIQSVVKGSENATHVGLHRLTALSKD